ncbi:divergent PAP2 family protein [Nanoarchaeota archaeon]
MINKILLAIIISAGLTQLIKISILVFKHKQQFYWKDFFVTGGMPSAHSSVVTSLSLIIFLTEGLSSSFFISIVLMLIVIRDAMGVRRSVGEEGKILNDIIKKSKLKVPKVHYSLGHTPKEVFVGVVIGILTSVIIYLF